MYLHLFEHKIEDDILDAYGEEESWVRHFPKLDSILWTTEKLEDYYLSNKKNYSILDDYITFKEYGYDNKWDIYRIAKYMILYEMGGVGVDLELVPPDPDSMGTGKDFNSIFFSKSFTLERYIVIFKETRMTADQYYQVPNSEILYSTNLIYSSCIKHGFFYQLLKNIAFRTYEKYFAKEYVYFYLPQFLQKKEKSQKRFSVLNNKIWYDLIGNSTNKIRELKEVKDSVGESYDLLDEDSINDIDGNEDTINSKNYNKYRYKTTTDLISLEYKPSKKVSDVIIETTGFDVEKVSIADEDNKVVDNPTFDYSNVVKKTIVKHDTTIKISSKNTINIPMRLESTQTLEKRNKCRKRCKKRIKKGRTDAYILYRLFKF